ncbi:MAG: HAD hydrolase family protein [Gammaproteobacteria bacterium]|nr:HAD hydrolase family protein [Gammaproteobacteria bacterium]NNF49633.1 HAD hydrolase family protein [Woeseiaceae bacterium]MBT8095129.1 HAD hydrolase family protein [Gammaproteobacteria bacterium]MBT8104597.1 HAD hydrolase family protein [Gammaproteobacteria bacterium]NNK24611.1 HAD hydrolase family protein [Woeseiaceae bacterium]
MSGGLERLAQLRLVAFDVDGVFTDGRFYLSDDGIETKAFHTQDGYGIRRLIDSGIEVAVISGRNSGAVEKRMEELGVAHVVLGCKDKVAAMDDLAASLGIEVRDCAFVGDDMPDLALLGHVGFSVAVANAVQVVQERCDYITRKPGGAGAVREVCDLVVAATSP